MNWSDNMRMANLYKEMMSVIIADIESSGEGFEQEDMDGPQLLKCASECLNHLIIELQQSGPSDITKEKLIEIIQQLKEAGKLLFCCKEEQISSYTGMPDEECHEHE